LRRVSFLIPLALILAAALTGCSSEESRCLTRVQRGIEPAAGDFTLAVELCRKVSRKSGRRIGVQDEFEVRNRAYVHAFADFRNVRPGRDYTVHLVWIKPGGKELFRKFFEVRQTPGEEGFETVINWLDAEDLHKIRTETQVSETPDFTLDSRYNISARRERKPGLHHFRVYLDRALVYEKPFTVLGPDPTTEEEEDDDSGA